MKIHHLCSDPHKSVGGGSMLYVHVYDEYLKLFRLIFDEILANAVSSQVKTQNNEH
jgi:hypothetical protein